MPLMFKMSMEQPKKELKTFEDVQRSGVQIFLTHADLLLHYRG